MSQPPTKVNKLHLKKKFDSGAKKIKTKKRKEAEAKKSILITKCGKFVFKNVKRVKSNESELEEVLVKMLFLRVLVKVVM